MSIRVRQHGAAFCCILDPKIFKDYVNKFRNRDLVSFECLNESRITINKIDRISQKSKDRNTNKKVEIKNQNKNDNNTETESKPVKKKKKIIKKKGKGKKKDKDEDENEVNEKAQLKEKGLIYTVKDKEIEKTGSMNIFLIHF